MGKYDPLQKYLENIPPTVNIQSLTFKRIEEILGSELPKSAYNHRAWWSNPTSPSDHPHAQSWLKAGWRVDSVDQTEKLVHFCRLTNKDSGIDYYNSGFTRLSNTSHKDSSEEKKDEDQSQGNLKLLLLLGFEEIGKWLLVGDKLKFVLSKYRNERNILYAFIVQGKVNYIGKSTMTLNHRMNEYKNPGPSQTTNIKNNERIKGLLQKNIVVQIFALVPKEKIFYNGFALNIAAGLEDNLLAQVRPPWNKRK